MPPPASNVLVTGAAGFVGRWLVRDLETALAGRAAVTAAGTVRSGAGAAFDITDAEAVDAAIARIRPTCVIHLAAVSAVTEARQDAGRAWQVNLLGTLHLAEAMLRHTPRARLIFASTAEVYGASFRTATGPLDEAAPLRPVNCYAATKAAAEMALSHLVEEGLDVVVFRPFNHSGPGQAARFVLPAFAAQIAAIERGEQPPVLRVGNLDARRDFLDVRDVVTAYRRAVLADPLPRRCVLNLASGTPRRIGDVLDQLLAMARVPIGVEQDPDRMRPNDVPMSVGRATAAERTLGWHPEVAWDTTLRDILEHQRRAHG